MASKIIMEKQGLPVSRSAYQGFSWTTFLWGPLPPLFRADGIGFLIAIPVVIASFFIPIVPFFIWAFFYNKNHLDRLVRDGWVPMQSLQAPVPPTMHYHVHAQHPQTVAQTPPPMAVPEQPQANHSEIQPPVEPQHVVDPHIVEAADPAAEEQLDGSQIEAAEPNKAIEAGKPAGWYVDPYSAFGERWWDGQSWSEQCR